MELTTGEVYGRERPWAVSARQDTVFLDQIRQAVNGPFHLVHANSFAENLIDFRQVLDRHHVSGQVFYGKKANKASVWLREVARLGEAIDVASVPEFSHALSNGIRGESIGVTGAAKSDELLWLASRHGATVAIDSLDELERAITVARHTMPLRILLRVLPSTGAHSRFGLSPVDLRLALRRCEDVHGLVVMDGFSFHLDGYEVAPRVKLADVLVEQCLEARRQGFPASAISIGGGFACCYVEQEDWRLLMEKLDPSLFHADRTFSHFYPYHQSPTGAEMLDAILASEVGKGTLASRLNAAGINLYLEPGRALLDGAGMSVFPVQGFKQNADHGLVTVAGLSMSLSEQWKSSEFLPAPRLVQYGPKRPQDPVRAAIGGSSCMEYDVLTWRKVLFPATPQYGDLIVYSNTAGYQMDKNESEFHQLSLPPKIVVTDHGGDLAWRLDS